MALRAFVKDCWGRQIPASAFWARLSSEFGPGHLFECTTLLFDFVSGPPPANCLLLDYLEIILAKDPSLASTIVSDHYINHGLGLGRFLVSRGDRLFRLMRSVDAASVRFALDVIESVVSDPSPDQAALGFRRLIDIPIFNVLLSASRSLFRDQFLRVRGRIDAARLMQSGLYQPLARAALFDESFENFGVPHDHLAMFSSSFQPCYLESSVFRVARDNILIRDDLEHLFCHFLADFMTAPTFLRAFVMTHTFVTVFEMRDAATFVRTLFRRPSSLETREYRTCDYILSEFTEEQLISYFDGSLTTPLSDLSGVLARPGLSARFVEILTQFSTEHFQVMIGALLNYIDDFTNLLIVQSSLLGFLNYLSGRMKDTSIMTLGDFDRVFLFYVSIIRYSLWRSGSRRARVACEEYIRQEGDSELRYFLWGLVGREEEMGAVSGYDIKSPSHLRKVLGYFRTLMHTGDLNVGDLVSRPPLWLCAIVWGLITKSDSANALAEEIVPNDSVVKMLFYDLMVVLKQPVRAWMGIADFDYLVRTASDIAQVPDLMLGFSELRNFPEAAFQWRAWVKIFGLHAFGDLLLKTLRDGILRTSFFTNLETLFLNAAAVFTAAVDCDGEIIFGMIQLVHSRLRDSDRMSDSFGNCLAHFALFLILAMSTGQSDAFTSLLALKQFVGARNMEGIAFLATLIKLAMRVPSLRRIVPDDAFQVLVRRGDWQGAIDFFVAKTL
jgi:hypothetical protein